MDIPESSNFIQDIIVNDLQTGKRNKVLTRFPPEPNGYIHIGHAKSICLNFGTAQKFGGFTNLRFDDTNPTKEDVEYVDSIREDVKWLGFQWKEEFFASDYYDQIYAFAEKMIEMGKAYVEDLTRDEMQEYRGNDAGKPSKPSPYRDRSVEENMKLFREMRDGKYADGEKCLRAKVDLASPNMNMRDPVIYRTKHCTHHRTGDKWCIYPMYDFAHPISDWIEGITHSICTLEFEAHRPLYDWFLIELGLENRPQQIEFSRLNLTYTMMSKRKLLELVETKAVLGWNDPRMPTVCGFRRRGFTPSSIREFCSRIGVSKAESMVDVNLLYFCIREELNQSAKRAMAVIDPVKVVIDNWEDGKVEMVEVENNPNDPNAGTRMVPFSKELYIEAEDFMEEPPKKYFRLKPEGEVRLKGAYFVTCKSVEKDADGKVTVIHCEYDPASKGGESPDGRKVKGTIHWVSAAHAVDAEVRLIDNLFTLEDPSDVPEGEDWHNYLNPESMVIKQAKLEPSLADAKMEDRFQFLRLGYFCLDSDDSKPGKLVFNRTVGLKDSFNPAK
ncbi:glutaminyl-tRNA synthetase [Fibrobacter sp. UWH9]|uniref:glutamine--tRNA ligase/YqeY domain fusion protein n=1 Tax=unclassified Fibrobacter TaxID=2634177 RepID=UPI000918418C|nr:MULTISPECIES: glutamine--tRNA ligase/YqeY domain fusion protein [unclassified Fibrobacter]MCQ2099383.1 glutamine--tRNA ligase/YqeY domain fusion protein [Fibrobacter sp.]OWV06911.1 glutamine--tRNA ligase [Fibrobacter sp. UWH3]OWV16206.1 glutamine--tRNA ligase [Fibrobacter sp. UWH1]SHG54240.1 glutaminyl-tRNA synthetase [Fibrobacter sp. UWH9]SHK21424.1 glutaminyl-tRNA synthetase [Fibrobacter sp. UWH6]